MLMSNSLHPLGQSKQFKNFCQTDCVDIMKIFHMDIEISTDDQWAAEQGDGFQQGRQVVKKLRRWLG